MPAEYHGRVREMSRTELKDTVGIFSLMPSHCLLKLLKSDVQSQAPKPRLPHSVFVHMDNRITLEC